jgi:glycerol-3-phosphate acyltransferase PlsY
MMDELNVSVLAVLLFCFFLGSIPFDRLMLQKKSHSWLLPSLVLLLNTIKGSLAVILGSLSTEGSSSTIYSWIFGFFSFLGDYYCPWTPSGKRKALYPAWGVFLVLAPLEAFIGLVGFLCTFFYKRIISFSSIAGLLLAAITYFVMNTTGMHLWIVIAFIFFILARYEKNIDALLIHEERPSPRSRMQT